MTAQRRLASQSIVVQELSAVLGVTVVEKLLADFGGVSLYIPKEPVGINHPLHVSIGASAASIVQDYFGGIAIDFPVSGNKREQIVALRQGGKAIRDIARQVGLTERRVYQVLAEEDDDAEPDLFT